MGYVSQVEVDPVSGMIGCWSCCHVSSCLRMKQRAYKVFGNDKVWWECHVSRCLRVKQRAYKQLGHQLGLSLRLSWRLLGVSTAGKPKGLRV